MKKTAKTLALAALLTAAAAGMTACTPPWESREMDNAAGVYGPAPDVTATTTVTSAADSEEELVIETKLPPSQTGAVEEAAPDELVDDDSDNVAEEGGIEEIE